MSRLRVVGTRRLRVLGTKRLGVAGGIPRVFDSCTGRIPGEGKGKLERAVAPGG
jgi:hypothetical protein